MKKLKILTFFFFLIVLTVFVGSQDLINKEEPKEPTIISRTYTTDVYDLGDGKRMVQGMGAVNYPYNGTFIPFEEINYTISNGELAFFEPDGSKIISFKMDYEKTNSLSSSLPKINVIKRRGGFYFTTDTDTEINSMKYILSSDSKEAIKFVDEKLEVGNVSIDFGMAKDLQNITTVYNEKDSTLEFSITDGKTGSLSFIDPDVGLKSPTAYDDDYDAWSNPHEALSSNDDYAGAMRNGEMNDWYNFNFGVPEGASIDGIAVNIEGCSLGIASSVKEVELSWDGGGSYTSENKQNTFGTTDSTETYGGSTDKWGRTWDDDEFSNVNFRVRVERISAPIVSGIDHIQVNVYYTEAATDSCTYGGSGDYQIETDDKCEYTDGETVIDGNLIINGTTEYVYLNNYKFIANGFNFNCTNCKMVLENGAKLVI